MNTKYGIIYAVIYKPKNKVVYVGQTIQSSRKRWNSIRRSKAQVIGKAIHKYGKESFEFVEIASAFSKPDLDFLEIYLINLLNTHTSKGGYNVELGGNSQDKMSKETLNKLKDNGLKASKSIYSINLDSKEILRFNSILDCSRFLKVGVGSICNVLKGRAKTLRGHSFCYSDNDPSLHLTRKSHEKPSARVPVEIRKLSSGETTQFNSLTSAASFLNIDSSTIVKVCSGSVLSVRGYTCRYLSKEFKHSFRKAKQGSKKPILAIDPNNIKMCFRSLKDAAEYLQTHKASISRVCLGGSVSYKGWKFWYLTY